MKHVYFLRHGQTVKNQKRIHQGPHEPLSEKGKEQASAVVTTLKQYPIDTIYASDYVRTRETAAIVGEELSLPYTLTDTVREFQRPDYVYGKSHYSLTSFLYLWRLFLNRTSPTWQHFGAENEFDIRMRAEAFTKKLEENIEAEHVLVVSHAIFMNMFVNVACKGELSSAQFFKGFLDTQGTKNTEIFHLTYDTVAVEGVCKWQLVEKVPPFTA